MRSADRIPSRTSAQKTAPKQTEWHSKSRSKQHSPIATKKPVNFEIPLCSLNAVSHLRNPYFCSAKMTWTNYWQSGGQITNDEIRKRWSKYWLPSIYLYIYIERERGHFQIVCRRNAVAQNAMRRMLQPSTLMNSRFATIKFKHCNLKATMFEDARKICNVQRWCPKGKTFEFLVQSWQQKHKMTNIRFRTSITCNKLQRGLGCVMCALCPTSTSLAKQLIYPPPRARARQSQCLPLRDGPRYGQTYGATTGYIMDKFWAISQRECLSGPFTYAHIIWPNVLLKLDKSFST